MTIHSKSNEFFFSRSKRRRNDEQKLKKPTDDEMEEGETKTNNEANGSTAPKRVPLSLEEMLERNKKEQEATAKVKLVILIINRRYMLIYFSRNF